MYVVPVELTVIELWNPVDDWPTLMLPAICRKTKLVPLMTIAGVPLNCTSNVPPMQYQSPALPGVKLVVESLKMYVQPTSNVRTPAACESMKKQPSAQK